MRKHCVSLDALLSKQICSSPDVEEVTVQPIAVGGGASFQADDYRVDVVMNADSIEWTFRDNDGKVIKFERQKIGAMPAFGPTTSRLSRAQRRQMNRGRNRV